MILIIALVFIGVFTVIALPLIGSGLVPSRTTQQALATLDSALKTETQEKRQLAMDLKKNETISSIPWLNQRLLKLELIPHLRRLLNQAALSWSPGRLMAVSLALLVIPPYVLLQYVNSIPLAILAGVVLGIAPLGWVLFKRSRRFAAFEKGLPEALDLMVSGLRAGHSLIAAMALVARECEEPIGPEFKVCFEEQNYGLEMKAALDNLMERVPLQDLKIVSSAIMIQKESGGNLAEVLDKASYIIRERFRLKKQIMVHTAQGRLTGLILACLPVVLGFGIYMVDPAEISILWHRDIGIKLLWGAAGLVVFGGFVIWRIVDIDV
ncbi:MAG: type II secretion system F family protein [Terracidiphilus sp.]